MEISVDKFKQYIKSKIPSSYLIVKSKNTNSAFDIKGFKIKIIEKNVKIENGENIVIELVEEVIKEKISNKKKIIKVKEQTDENKIIKSGSRWYDKEDNELKKRYNDEMLDIIEISNIHNRSSSAILLRLNRLGIINNLEEARGYELLDEKTKIKLS